MQKQVEEAAMHHRNLWRVVLWILAGLLLAACAQEPAAVSKIEPATIEEIAGSEFKRVVLTQKAAERLGIETVTVSGEQVARTRRVGGRVTTSPSVVLPDTGDVISEASDTNRVWVQVRLSQSDLQKMDRSQPARVLLISDNDDEEDDDDDLVAEPDEAPGADDGEDNGEEASRAVYYAVDNTSQRLAPGQSVFIEYALTDSATQRLVVPYAAVIYGLEGETWVYTNPEPLVYIREPIVVEYIEGDLAVLSEGPATGTPVVVVGVAELFGAETGVSK